MEQLLAHAVTGGMVTYDELRLDKHLLHRERHYHPPALTVDRTDYIVLPLLTNMNGA